MADTAEKKIEENPAPAQKQELRQPHIRFDKRYAEKRGTYWRIVVEGKYFYFNEQIEAIAFAKRIAADRGVNVTVLGENVQQRLAAEQAEAERLADEQAEADRLAAEKAKSEEEKMDELIKRAGSVSFVVPVKR